MVADAQQAARARGPLAPFRVLDLTNELGQLTGRMLGDLGADVIKVEPPGGDPSRWIAPFYRDVPDAEGSLHWWMFTHEDGRALFFDLVGRADFVLETTPPGTMTALGLGYDELAAAKPALVMTSITPFGQEGPYAQWRASDLIGAAMGGQMYLNGDPAREPLRPTVSQAYAQASVQAAVGTMTAHFHRTRTGEGQHVDASLQEAAATLLDNAAPFWDLMHVNLSRPGNGRGTSGRLSGKYVYEAADGYMAALSYGGIFGLNATQTVAWLDSHGAADDLGTPQWLEKLDARRGVRTPLAPDEVAHVVAVLEAFCRRFPRAQLMREAQAIRNGWAPVHTPRELLEHEHLRARDYWTRLDHAELGESFDYPGPWAKLSATPLSVRHRAPRIGEHNRDVYGGLLGLTPARCAELAAAGVI